MPVRKVGPNKWQWGTTGKVYNNRAAAARQGRAIKANQAKKSK